MPTSPHRGRNKSRALRGITSTARGWGHGTAGRGVRAPCPLPHRHRCCSTALRSGERRGAELRQSQRLTPLTGSPADAQRCPRARASRWVWKSHASPWSLLDCLSAAGTASLAVRAPRSRPLPPKGIKPRRQKHGHANEKRVPRGCGQLGAAGETRRGDAPQRRPPGSASGTRRRATAARCCSAARCHPAAQIELSHGK